MKVKFTKLAALLLAGAALFATGCTDYEVDIQKNADAIAAANAQISALQSAITSLQSTHSTDVAALNKAISDLQALVDKKLDKTTFEAAKKELEDALKSASDRIKALEDANFQKQIDDLKADVAKMATKEELQKAISDLETALKGEISNLELRVKAIEETIPGMKEQIQKLEKGVGDNAESIRLLKDAVKELKATCATKEELEKAVNDIMKKLDDDYATKEALQAVVDEVLAVKGLIRSLVFVPEVYVDGVEAILIQSLKYPTQTIEDEVYNTNEEVAVESEDSLTVSPKVIAKYHVIPSDADLSFLDTAKINFVIRPNDPFKTIRTRAEASEDFNVTGKYLGRDKDEPDVICIEVEVEGTAATDEYISVVALQVAKEKETYTSDYACIYSEALDSLRIAMPADEDYHYRRALEEVAGISALDDEAGIKDLPVYTEEVDTASCDTVLIYDTPLDLLTITETHVVAEGSEGCQVIDPAKLGLDWKFELVDIEGWTVGAIDNITLSGTEITADIDAMDLTPVVRTYLFNEDEENAQIAYIKFYVAPQDFENNQDMGEFEFSCEGDTLEVVTNVYEKFGMSKETFLRVYPEFKTTLEEEEDAEETNTKAEAEEEDAQVGTDEVTFDPETGKLTWTADAAWVWNNAVDEADAPGDVLTKEVYFVNPNNGAVFTVSLEAKRAVINEYRVNARKDDKHMAHYYENYWNTPWLTAAQYNVRVPQQGETEPDSCQFINNINAAFVTNDEGVIDLSDIGMANIEVSDVKYYFCISDMKKITEVRGIKVEFGTDDADSLTLTATVDGVTETIATIDNNYTKKAKTPSIVQLNKDSDIAKLLLNTNDAELVKKNEREEAFFYILIGGKALICGDDGFEVNLKWQSYPGDGEEWLDHFRADYIRPINLTKKSADHFTDAVDLGEKGSFITIKSLVAPKDWRGREFGLNESDLYYEYWSYYGVFKITADEDNITCNLNGVPGSKVPVTIEYGQVTKDKLLSMISNPDDLMRDKDGNYVKVVDGKAVWGAAADEALTIREYIDFLHPESSEEGFGFLYYFNNGTYVKEFTLDVPVKVEYGWGVIEGTHIEVPVETTIKE